MKESKSQSAKFNLLQLYACGLIQYDSSIYNELYYSLDTQLFKNHLENAPGDILEIVSGNIIFRISLQSLNALGLIISIPFGIVIIPVESLLQYDTVLSEYAIIE